MSECIFFNLDGDCCGVSRDISGNGFNKTIYKLDKQQGEWKPSDVTKYQHFDDLLLGIFKEQFKRTDRSPVAVFDAANLVISQMKEEVIRVRDL
ncbi:hypothetical protein QV08_09625 [Gallibacterium salpingitidis]|uniref:hypothetical protein n=1 Tax=Gallibacterium salpingitidis TaxID=505341 RepID=UPI00080509A7|nr:hypothetical protein [Gallibacterium salpingitidis]OBX06657.1 hypothetical protein QV08_09625 [Gallibacterium salpingitidis]